MSDLIDNLSDEQQEKLQEKSFPSWTEPMLATLTEDYFDNEDWLYERKLDGVRCLVFHSGNDIKIKSRNKNDLNNTYPELVEALEGVSSEPYIVDGEIVAFEGNTTSFSRLQGRINISDPEKARRSSVKVYLYLFDIIYLSEYDLSKLALRDRKGLLKKAMDFSEPIRYTPHRNEKGKEFYEEACNKGWEGVIAKDARARYVHSRSKKWLKFKCSMRQEFVIGGYTDPKGERIGFGALLLGYYKNGDLQYAGQVGTGFDDELLKNLHKKLSNRERKTNPFQQNDIKKTDVHWVSPELVGEVGFTEWTNDNKLRHPRFLGLRTDKKPENVHKEKS